MAGSAAISGFIGRAAELGRLEEAFGRVGDGNPLSLCVGGEAGVGKTRLVSEFTRRVRAQGGCVLTGGCIDLAEASLPYAPVVEALRGLARELQPPAVEELLGPGRPLLARLLPELARPEEPTGSTPPVTSSAQAALFEAFLALLERLADRSRTALVVEDLHWADHSTLDLVAFLVRNVPAALVVVLTYRTDELHRGHRLRPFLAGLDRSGRVERLELSRFDRAETGHLLAAILGSRPDDELAEDIYQRSEGNAFFAEELLAAAREGCRAEPAPQSGERPADPGPGSLRGRAGDTAVGGRRRWADRGGPVVRGERPAGRGPARSLAGRGRPPGAGSGSGRRDATASATR